MMPTLWQVYHCGPCSQTIARGGKERPMPCPGCQQPMTWIDKVRPFCLPGCDRLDGHDGRDAGACMRNGEVLEPGPPSDDRTAPGLPYKFFEMTPLWVSPDGEHWYREDR